MRLGLSLPVFTADVERPLAAARGAAASGYDGVFSVDHLFPPGSPGSPSLEAFAVLTAAAAENPTLTAGVLISRVGVRTPGQLAKEAAALDSVSGGGAVLGLGIGDAAGRAEHEAMGIAFPPLDVRRALLEEHATALRTLFDGARWPGGAHVPAMEGPLLPAGRPRVWLGGTSEPIVDAAARAADGWNGWGIDVSTFAARAARLRATAAATGRDPGQIEATWGGVVLAADDRVELTDLERKRDADDPPWAAWRGTLAELRRFRDDLADAGCSWMIVAIAGGDERAALVATALRDG